MTPPPHAAAAAADFDSSTNTDKRHTCPKCGNTWPKKFGPVCFTCQCDVELAQRQQKLTAEVLEEFKRWDEANPPPPPKPPISATANRLCQAMQAPLPEAWLYHQDLTTLIASRDLQELQEVLIGIGPHKLPEPDAFFEDYELHLQEHNRGEAELKAMAEAAA